MHIVGEVVVIFFEGDAALASWGLAAGDRDCTADGSGPLPGGDLVGGAVV